MYPILSGGDLSGAVALLTRDDGSRPENTQRKLAEVAAGFLGSQIES